MAITVLFKPTLNNVTGTELIYEVVGGVERFEPQYRYVMDIYPSGSNELISRTFQPQNTRGLGIFEPSNILDSLLSYDNNIGVVSSTFPTSSVKFFSVVFGEAYGTSPSSSVEVFMNPRSTANDLKVFKGVLDPNNGVSYNFNETPFNGNVQTQYLSNQPSYQTDQYVSKELPILSRDDYYTATTFFNDTRLVTVNGYLNIGSTRRLLATTNIDIGFPPDPSPVFPNNVSRWATIGFGPRNLSELDPTFNQLIASQSINEVELTGGGSTINYIIGTSVYENTTNVPISGSTDTLQYQYMLPCNSNFLQFAFINRYGFYDYHTVFSPLKRETSLSYNTVSLPSVDYNSVVGTYNILNGGESSYYTDTSDTYSIDTGWLSKPIANWLEELIESPEVYVNQEGTLVPIIIENSTYQENNSTSRNKLFKYTITFRPAIGREINQGDLTPPGDLATRYTIYHDPKTIGTWNVSPNVQLPPSEQFSKYWTPRDFQVGLITGSGLQIRSASTTTIYKPGENGFNPLFTLSGSVGSAVNNWRTFKFTQSVLTSQDFTNQDIVFTSSSVNYINLNAPYFQGGYNFSSSFSASFVGEPPLAIYYSSSFDSWEPPSECANISAFDPTVGGKYTLNHWYDLTDCTVMNFKADEITVLEDKGNAPVPIPLTNASDVGNIAAGPTFIDSRSGSFFDNSDTQYRYLESTIVPDTMINPGFPLTYITILEVVGPASGNANDNRPFGTVVGVSNDTQNGYRYYMPAMYGSGSNDTFRPNRNTVTGLGPEIGTDGLQIGSAIQAGGPGTMYSALGTYGNYDTEYFLSSEVFPDYDGNSNSFYGYLYIRTGSVTAQSGRFTERTTQAAYSTQFRIGKSYDNDDIAQTRVKHVLIYSGSLDYAERIEIWNEWQSQKLNGDCRFIIEAETV